MRSTASHGANPEGSAAGLPLPALELAVQGLPVDLEHTSSFRTTATHGFQHLQDVPTLHFRQRQESDRVVRHREHAGRRARLSDLRRQVFQGQRIELAQDDRTLHTVLEFPDISRPVVVEQLASGLRGDAGHLPVEASPELLQKPLGQQQDVIAPLPKGRKLDRNDIESVQEVLPKLSAIHHPRQVPMGRRHDAHVDRRVPIRPDRPDTAFLKGPEQLGLHRTRKVADLIQEQGSTIGLREQARAIPSSIRERTPNMPEQLALEQRLGHRCAVHRHEGLSRTRRGLVERLRHELLAGAGLPTDEHRRGCGRYTLDEGVDSLHRG